MAAAAAAWAGAVAGGEVGIGGAAAVAACAVTAWRWRRRLGAVLLVAAIAAAAGAAAATRQAATLGAALPAGTVRLQARVLADPAPFGDQLRAPIRPLAVAVDGEWVAWRGPRLIARGDLDPAAAGDRVEIIGRLRPGVTRWRGDPAAGTMAVAHLATSGTGSPLLTVGNTLRRVVQRRLPPGDPRSGLLAGFLIGDTSGLPENSEEELRRAGLSHYVAVSGSNVALFLGAWWLAMGPLAWKPQRRAALGLVALAVFVVATRWEPSVVRAATMAGLVLVGRLAGMLVDAWAALGGAVTLLLVVSPELTASVGFQLSVAATAGVLAGARLFAGRRPRWVWVALGATLSAQVAVTPLLLIHFGAVPLVAVPANVLAAPLVAGATSLAGIGVVTGLEPFLSAARGAAGAVLAIGKAAAQWPQLGIGPTTALAGVMAAAARLPRLRPLSVLAVAGALLAGVLPPSGPDRPALVVLDVGQGDSILLLGERGAAVLVDGGPSPGRLRAGLRRYGVRRIELMVATHHHADHVTGLRALLAEVPVAELWMPDQPDPGEVFVDLADLAGGQGTTVRTPQPGTMAEVDGLTLEVLGPLRRYASPNDGSLVLRVSTGTTSVLLPGDIEAIAQADLGPQPADILKVPHQGAATSDLRWLEASAPALAVISVGDNDFGHPDPEVVATLEDAGAAVYRTDVHGDVVVPLEWAVPIGNGLGTVPP